ncbi:MAG: thrombospondin type 3 repeat-containing protein, partial [Myxococcota bacterium]
CGWAPGDVLVGVAGPCGAGVVAPAGALGLLPGDDMDALAVNFDADADFVVDPCDNCFGVPNNDQLDGDFDGDGDVCDLCIGWPNADFDVDGYCDSFDNCPAVANPSQANVDGDLTGDDCDPCPADATDTCCPATPDACTGGFGKGILMKKEAAGKEKLIAKFLKGPLINQVDFGNPLALGDTKYSLCIYDDTPTLVGEIVVDRAGQATCSGGASTCWGALGGTPPAGKGYKFKDSGGVSDGIGTILLKGGPASAGKSKALLKGKGVNIPSGVTAALTATTSVTVQLRGDDAPPPGCWSVTLSTISKQTADFFKAK